MLEFDLPLLNRTGTTLTLTAIETSCTCLKVQLTRHKLEPGESGSVHAVLKLPEKTGIFQKALILTTNSETQPTELVMLKLEVPSVLKITPASLTWKVGEPPLEQVVRITVPGDFPVNVLGIEGKGNWFKGTLNTVREGREYEVRIKPEGTQQAAKEKFILTTDSSLIRQTQQEVEVGIE